jgi:hypothetical protein
VVRYPHTLNIIFHEDGYYDEDDNYVQGNKKAMKLKGRAEPNSGGRQLVLGNGGIIAYEWRFYTKRFLYDIPYGSKAEIPELGWVGIVQRAHNYQTGGSIWL